MLLLCLAIVAGAVVMNRENKSSENVITSLTNLKTANSTATTGNKFSFDWLSDTASDAPTFNTSKPTLLYDFSTSDASDDFKNGHDTIHVEKEGYYSFRIDGSDPYVWLGTPGIKGSDAKYAVFYYRTDLDAQGELYVQRNDGVEMGQTGSHMGWKWNATGEWETLVLLCDAWGSSDAKLNILRLDPMANGKFEFGKTTIDIFNLKT